MALELGHVERSMAALTIGAVKKMNERRYQRTLDGLAEREEQFQIEITGRAEEFYSWQEVDLEFRTLFVDATGQRESAFDRPTFYYGAYIERGGPVGVLACVTEWKVNERNETLGCKLAIGVAATDQPRKFKGQLHAVFQGYGAPGASYGAENEDQD